MDNAAWACVFCNNGKGTDLGTLVGQPPKLVRLFHPRQERWATCFQLVGVRLEALNPMAEATVKLLQLKHESRMGEREALAAVGRFPTIEALARMKE